MKCTKCLKIELCFCNIYEVNSPHVRNRHDVQVVLRAMGASADAIAVHKGESICTYHLDQVLVAEHEEEAKRG